MYRRATTLARWLGAAALLAAFALPAQAQRNVTLRLNTATLPDTTTMTTDIQVRGCLNECEDNQSALPGGQTIAWDDRTTLAPDNEGGDYWSINFQIPDDELLKFKFFSDQAEVVAGIGGWEDGSDHEIAAGTGDVNLVLHYFEKGDDKAYDWRPFGAEGDSVAVWFRVYMNTTEAIEKGYDRDDATVGVRGDGTLGGSQDGGTTTIDWGATNILLDRESGDDTKPGYDLFSGRVAFPASAVGQVMNYKFFLEPDGWEGPDGTAGCSDDNRCFTVPAQDSTLMWVYYGDSDPLTGEEPVTSQIIFEVDGEPLVDVGVLDLTRGDEFQVRGGFNGWDCPDDNQDDCGLFREPGTFSFGNVIPVTAVPTTTATYKYFAVLQNVDQEEFGDYGYEEPLDFGGGNRSYTFAGDEQQEIGIEFFNTIRAGNVIPDQTVDVTFTVDMTAALGYAGEDAFDPATDMVYVAFEDQIWRLTQGYEPGELTASIDPEFTLTSIGDNIYQGTYTVQGPTYNGIGYAYAWGEAGPKGTTTREGAGGFDAGRRRYRYITPDGGGTFPGTFAFAQDVVVGADDLNRWECNPTDPNRDQRIADDFCEENGYVEQGTVGIEDVGGNQPEAALLSPNYPNPFRSSTTFEYAVSESGPVKLAVYDVMGRQVALLVDEAQPASTYRVGFDAPDLASGIYFVRLQASGKVLSRKITVVN